MGSLVPMEPLTWVSGSFAARVLAARLQDEGIDAELRGALDSPYSFTLGDLARVDVFVPRDQVDDAELVMTSIEVDCATDLEPAPRRRAPVSLGGGLVLVLVVAAVAPVVRYVAA
jgi:hypothetical protein